MRILIGRFSHESNTFCRRLTTQADFSDRSYYVEQEVIPRYEGTRTGVGGFMDVCREEGASIVPTVGADACPGGPVSRSVFETFKRDFQACAEKSGPWDGMLLSLHGAMVLEDAPDGEGELLAWIRQTWGRDFPIAVVLDFHGNISPAMVTHADALIPYDCYPHTDAYERGCEAARLLIAILRGEVTPCMTHRRVPILCPLIPTSEAPMRDFLDRAHQWEQEPGVCSVSVMAGFPWADVPDAGMSVLCVTDGDEALGRRIADDLAGRIGARRNELVRNPVPVDEAVDSALADPDEIVLLADVADNPGAGCPGDGTAILRALLERGASGVACAVVPDPETVAVAHQAGIGAEVSVCLGGKLDVESGGPIQTRARVKALTDGRYCNEDQMSQGAWMHLGATAVLEIGNGIDVIVTERRVQPYDAAVFSHAKIDLKKKSVLVIKSSVHYRASFAPRVDRIIEVDAPGIISMNFHRFAYRHVSRPVYPLDEMDV